MRLRQRQAEDIQIRLVPSKHLDEPAEKVKQARGSAGITLTGCVKATNHIAIDLYIVWLTGPIARHMTFDGAAVFPVQVEVTQPDCPFPAKEEALQCQC